MIRVLFAIFAAIMMLGTSIAIQQASNSHASFNIVADQGGEGGEG